MTVTDIATYHSLLSDEERGVCEELKRLIDTTLKGAASKVWHGSPVWFLNGNPIVGYAARKKGVQLLFWSGQSFDEPGLQAEGSFKAAEKYYRVGDTVDAEEVVRWLTEAGTIQWDYKNIVKRKGRLERL